MIVRNRIWEEMQKADRYVRCMQWYTDNQRRRMRRYDICVALTATLGTFGYIWDETVPFISSLLIASGSLFKSLFPKFLQPETELRELDNLTVFYNQYLTDMEYLFHACDYELKSEEDIVELFIKKKKEESKNQTIVNRLIRSIPEKVNDKINKDSLDFMNRVYKNYFTT